MAGDDERVAVEYCKCFADPAYFADRYLVIDDTQGLGDGSGTIPFRLWPDQCRVMWSLASERLVLILKARQLGISWLCCAYALWVCLFAPGKLVLLFSKGQAEANELLRRVKVLYRRLPPPLLALVPGIVKDNTEEVVFGNESRIQSLPATQNAGRSFTASLVILDEAAFLAWADDLYAALKPTVDAGGKLVVVSTARGVGNLFHRLWTRASAGLGSFRAIFLPWWSRPGRDRAWHDALAADSADPDLIKQEYPSNPTEAFVASGRVRFRGEWVAAQEANLRDPARPPDPLGKLEGLSYHAGPVRGGRYLISADVAEGLDGGDYSAGVAADADTGEEMASLHGRWEPGEFADSLFLLAAHYDCPVAVERNNHGHAVLLRLAQLVGGQGVSPKVRVWRGADGRPGWLTNNVTKPLAVDAMAESLRDGTITVRTRAALSEMQVYAVGAGGKTGAPGGYHDDLVTAWFIHCGARARILADDGPLAY